MAFDFTSALASMRKVVHDTFGCDVVWQDAKQLADPVPLRVRWHSRLVLQGDLVESGYADSIEGVNRMIFEKAELSLKSVALRRGDTITFDAKWNNAVLTLDSLEPADGPVNVTWKVAKA